MVRIGFGFAINPKFELEGKRLWLAFGTETAVTCPTIKVSIHDEKQTKQRRNVQCVYLVLQIGVVYFKIPATCYIMREST